MAKIIRLTENDLVRLVKKVINEQQTRNTISELTTDTMNSSFNKVVYSGMEYRGTIGGKGLKGAIGLNWEFSEMNKRNNWNRPERIETDFSSARPLTLSQQILDDVKAHNLSITNNVKSMYDKIFFQWLSEDATLLGQNIKEGKAKSKSVLMTADSGSERLFLFQSALDNNWYYFTIVYP